MNRLSHMFFFLLLTACVVVLSKVLLKTDVRPASPAFDQVAKAMNLGERIPLDIIVRNERGEWVDLSRYFGKHPMVLTMGNFGSRSFHQRVLQELAHHLSGLSLVPGKDFGVVAVSLDLEEPIERAAALRRSLEENASRRALDRAWHFLASEPRSVWRLTETIGFQFRYDADNGQYLHEDDVVVLARDGTIVRLFPNMNFTANDLRLGLVEAARGRYGSAADRLRLLVYDYSLLRGRYGFAVAAFLRKAAVGGLLALGTALFLMLRRERRRADRRKRAGTPPPGFPERRRLTGLVEPVPAF